MICPNVVEVRICTAISQANVSHSALMLGSPVGVPPGQCLEPVDVCGDLRLCANLY